MRIRSLTKCALMTALLCVVSPISVPLGSIPLSLATFGVYLCSIIFKPLYAVLSVAAYIMIGAIGVPVFSGLRGGAGVIAGPTGGFLAGYLFCVWISSVIKNKVGIPASLALGTIALYAFGAVWFAFVTESTILHALTVCAMPFIWGDAVKIIVATVVGKKLKNKI